MALFNLFKSKQVQPDTDLDFELDLNFDTTTLDPKKGRHPTLHAAKGAAKGFGKSILSPSTIARTINKTLGKEFDVPFSTGKSLLRELKATQRDTFNEIKEGLNATTQTLGKLSEFTEGKIPAKLQQRLASFNRSSTAGQLRPDETPSDPIGDALLALSEATRKDNARNATEERLDAHNRDFRQTTRDKALIALLTEISKNTSFSSSYSEKIDSSYKAKQLELSIKSYSLLGQISELITKTSIEQTAELKAITKNTGLPDFVKLRNQERMVELARTNMMENFLGGLISKRGNFFGALGQYVRSGVSRGANNFMGSLRSGLDGANSAMDAMSLMNSMSSGLSKEEKMGIYGEMLGSGLASTAGGFLGNKLNKRLNGNNKFNSIRNKMLFGYENISQILSKKASQPYDYNRADDPMYGIQRAIMGTMNDFLTQFRSGASFVDMSGKSIPHEDMERQKYQATVHTTPGLLARILREITYIGRGEDTPLVAYDYKAGKFTTQQAMTKEILGELFSSGKRDNEKYKIDKFFETVDPSGKLTSSQRRDLALQMTRYNLAGIGAADRNYFTNASSFTGKNSKTYADMFGAYLGDDPSGHKLKNINRQFTKLGANYQITPEEIQSIINSGGLDSLRRTGLIDATGRIDNEKILRIFANGGRYQPPEERYNLPSGDKRRVFDREWINQAQGFNEGIGGLYPNEPIADRSTDEILDAVRMNPNRELLEQIMAYTESIDTTLKNGIPTMSVNLSREEMQAMIDSSTANRGYINRGLGLLGRMGKSAASTLKQVTQFTSNSLRKIAGLPFKPFLKGAKAKLDLWIEGELKPRLTMEKLKAGQYIDAQSQKVIRKWEDIKGDVIDTVTGKIALYKEELGEIEFKDIAMGIFRKGASIIKVPLDFLWGKRNIASSAVTRVISTFKKVQSTTLGLTKSLIWAPQDVYVKGDPSPRLLARMMKAGAYVSMVTGKVIKTPFDIDGPVADRKGDIHLSLDDLKQGIVNKFGEPFRNRISQSLRNIFKGASWVGGKMIQSAKWLAEKGVEGFEFLTKGAGNVLGGVKDLFGKRESRTNSKTNDWLEKIYKLLDKRLAGRSKLRRNSAEDMKQRGEGMFSDPNADGAELFEDGTGQTEGWMKRFGKGMFKLFGGFTDTMKNIFIGKNGKGGLLGGLVGVIGSAVSGVASAGSSLMDKIFGGGTGSTLDTATKVGAGAVGATAVKTGLGITVGAGSVILGAATATGIGVYRAFKDFNMTMLNYFRYVQYGFQEEESSRMRSVYWLENQLYGRIKWSGNRAVGVEEMGIDYPSLMGEFGADADDQDEVTRWATWYSKRFIPIYLAHLTALKQTNSSVEIDSLDSLSNEDKIKYFDAVKVNPETYNYMENPFSGWFVSKTLKMTRSDVIKMIERIRVLVMGKASDVNQKVRGGNILDSFQYLIPIYGQGKMAYDTYHNTKDLMSENAAVKAQETEQSDTHLQTIARAYSGEGDIKLPTSIDAFMAIKFKAYGLNEMATNKIYNLLQLEAKLNPKVTSKNGNAQVDVDVVSFAAEMAGAFGCSDSAFSQDRRHWMIWFQDRFLPVYLSYATQISRMVGSGFTTLVEAQRKLAQGKYFNVIQLVLADITGVWKISSSPWPGYMLNNSSSSVGNNVESLKQLAAKETIPEENMAGRGSMITRRFSNGSQMAQNTPNSGPGRTGPTSSGNPPRNSSAVSRGPSPIMGMPSTGSMEANITSGGAPVRIGTPGSAVNYKDLPLPTGSSWEGMKNMLAAIGLATGMPARMLGIAGHLESGFNANSRASTSSASGLMQFTNKTWASTVARYGSKYGILASTPWSDPRANALMAAELMKENYNGLKNIIGTPTEVDLYAAHMLGLPTVIKMYKASPGAIASVIAPDAASANPYVFYDNWKTSVQRPRTVSDLFAYFNGKVAGAVSTLNLDSEPITYQGVPSQNVDYNLPSNTGYSGQTARLGGINAGAFGSNYTIPSQGGGGYTPAPGNRYYENDTNNYGNPDYSSTTGMTPSSDGEVMRVVLSRGPSTPDGTFGTMSLPNGMSFATLELPWKNNQNGVSCIPPGKYIAKKRTDSTPGTRAGLPFVYELKGVPGRSAIQIHPGNYAGDKELGKKSNVEGCILLGMGIGNFNGQRGVIQSSQAVTAFNNALGGRDVEIVITGETNNTTNTGINSPVGNTASDNNQSMMDPNSRQYQQAQDNLPAGQGSRGRNKADQDSNYTTITANLNSPEELKAMIKLLEQHLTQAQEQTKLLSDIRSGVETTNGAIKETVGSQSTSKPPQAAPETMVGTRNRY